MSSFLRSELIFSPFILLRDHAAELGNEVPSEPLLFMKPSTAIIQQGQSIEVKVLLAMAEVISSPLHLPLTQVEKSTLLQYHAFLNDPIKSIFCS